MEKDKLVEIEEKLEQVTVQLETLITQLECFIDVYCKNRDFDIINGILTRYRGSKDNVVVPGYVYDIDEEAFSNNKSLVTIELPYSIKEIQTCAFKSCTNLSNVIFSNKIKYIYSCAFLGCNSLKYIALPDSMEYLGPGAFMKCTNLKMIYIPKSIHSVNPLFYTEYVQESFQDNAYSENLVIYTDGTEEEITEKVNLKVPRWEITWSKKWNKHQGKSNNSPWVTYKTVYNCSREEFNALVEKELSGEN